MSFYEQWTYLGVFVVLLMAGFGMPLPEDVPLLTGGYLCYAGYAHAPIMIGVGMVGVLVGDIVLFSVGRRLGHDVVRRRFLRRMVNPGRLILAERLFAKHGVKIIFAGRFLPGLRPMIFMASGVLRVPLPTFILVNGLAACVSVPTLILLGTFFGYKLPALKREVSEVTHLIVVCAAVLALVAAGFYLHHHQKTMLAKAHLDGSDILPDPTNGAISEDTRPNPPSHRNPELAERNT